MHVMRDRYIIINGVGFYFYGWYSHSGVPPEGGGRNYRKSTTACVATTAQRGPPPTCHPKLAIRTALFANLFYSAAWCEGPGCANFLIVLQKQDAKVVIKTHAL